MKNVVLMLLPIFVRQLSGDLLQLVGKTFFAGNLILLFQCRRNHVFIFRMVLPKERAAGIVPASRVGYIEDVPDSRLVAGGVDERNTSTAAPDIPAHFFVPKLITGTGRRIGALGIDHELLMVRIFVEPGGSFQKVRPAFMTGGDLHRRFLCDLLAGLQFCRHIFTTPSCYSNEFYNKTQHKLDFQYAKMAVTKRKFCNGHHLWYRTVSLN
ncbi:hypothetical protein OUY18_11615 [Caproiciproducens galactitolivorans]|uniref:Secreted protein n=1 Tax=Caproiciproducens galactitolivorans TaxID=642589 RepID=A0ABT4BY90_9FIRM|nr:hypothetical protein [Caproiciproducens galactitolivorans]MCY1714898.1 hypothetical protein [Caproiciproducens galactitolivorans]